MPCPNCNSEHFDMNKKDDGQGYWELERYSCLACGCEWEWEMKKTITKEGKEEEGDEILSEEEEEPRPKTQSQWPCDPTYEGKPYGGAK